jgi:hypothetical protein
MTGFLLYNKICIKQEFCYATLAFRISFCKKSNNFQDYPIINLTIFHRIRVYDKD